MVLVWELAVEFGVDPQEVAGWMATLTARAAMWFDPKSALSGIGKFEREFKRLRAKMEQPTVKLEWLEKRARQPGLWGLRRRRC